MCNYSCQQSRCRPVIIGSTGMSISSCPSAHHSITINIIIIIFIVITVIITIVIAVPITIIIFFFIMTEHRYRHRILTHRRFQHVRY